MEDEKQLTLADGNLRDIKPIFASEIDVAVGEENSFEVEIKRALWDRRLTFGNVLYIKNTEYGGIIGEINTSTKKDTISIAGKTWRGKLSKKVIRPPTGEDYRKESGELNEIVKRLVEEQFDDYFVVSNKDTGIYLENYKFERYCSLLDGIVKMLRSAGYKLKIAYRQQERGSPGYVELSSEKIVDYSEKIEFSQDSKLHFNFKNNRNGVNHLICLGKGELKDRQVIDLYVQEDGSIGETQYYKGVQEVAEVYENTSAELEELKEKGTEKLEELANRTSFKMDVEKLGKDVEIGDIVGGRDYLTGLYAKKPITKKIYRVENGKKSLEYKIEGDD